MRDDGSPVALGTHKQRALLAALLLRANQVVSTDRLIEDIWGEDPPPAALKALRAYISRLRRTLEVNGQQQLRTVGAAYRLDVDASALDRDRFERLLADAREARTLGDLARASTLLRSALGLWRGPPLADLANEPFVEAEIARLEEMRLLALEDRIEVDLELGGQSEFVSEVRSLVRDHPFRERLWGHLMIALYRSGRQAEALEAYREARTVLADELGIEPGEHLRRIETSILRHDPTLEAPSTTNAVADAVGNAATIRTQPPRRPTADVRKVVTIVFCDVAGSTGLGERLDPEALRQVMARYFDTASETLRRHGGTIEKFIGDAVMAVFGVPTIREDDALRAVRAAWELSGRLSTLNEELGRTWGVRLEVRIGINTGEVFASGDSPDAQLITGDAVNTAARLQQSAEPGDILIGEKTHRLVAGAVQAAPLEPFSLRGKIAPVRALRVEGILPGAPGFVRRLDAPLVGRRGELAQLRQAFDRSVRDDSGFLFTVIGPPGIGKTRLATQFSRGLAGSARVLTGRCLPYGDGITYWPLREVLEQALGSDPLDRIERLLRGEPEVEGIVGSLAAALGTASEASTSDEVFWAVRRVLEALARRAPLVVVLEDVHWGEPTFLDFVDRVSGLISAAPVMFLCLARPELIEARPTWGGGKLNAATILLEPLSDAESALLLRRFGADVDNRRSEDILRAAEGNPLFIEQLLATAVELEPKSDLQIPATIDALLAARVDRLAPAQRDVLDAAAVVGRDFSSDAVAHLIPDDRGASVRTILDDLVHKQFLRHERPSLGSERTLAFRHVLIQAVTYAAIPKKQRADRHERLATWMERRYSGRISEVEEILAYHLEQAHRSLRELETMSPRAEDLALRAAEHLAACGRRAIARGDAAGATNLLSRALDLLDAVPERLPAESTNTARWILFLRGQALGRLGDVRRGRIDLETALRDARRVGDRSLEMNATNELGFLLAGAADYREAVPLLEQSLRIAETAGDHAGQVNALARLSIVETNRLRLDLALERAHRAHQLARQHEDPRSLAMALDALEVASVMVGDMAEVDRIAPQLVELHRRRGDPWYQQFALFQWSWVPLAAARWEEAAARVEEAWAINREIGDRGNEALYPATLGWIARATGDYGRALEYGRRSVELAEAADHIEFIAWAAGILGWTYEELFATDDAVAVLTHSLESAEHAGALVELPRAVGHLAFLRCNQGAESETRALIARGDAVLADVTTPDGKAFLQTADGAIALARAHALVGQRADAEVILTDVSTAADAAGWQELRASAALTLGTPPLEGNRSCVERALRIADASRLQAVGWRAHAALAGILDGIEADRHLASAKEAVAKLASTIDDDDRISQVFETGASEQIDRAMSSS